MDAPYTHRDFRRPASAGPLDEGLRHLLVKRQGAFHGFVHAQLAARRGRLGRHGLPLGVPHPGLPAAGRARSTCRPPGTAPSPRAARSICSFVPRPLDFGPDAIPCPYPHASVDCDEFIFYCRGNFTSRRGVGPGSISHHPAGVMHGPHPGAYEGSVGAQRTDELAVMLDTYAPLQATVDGAGHRGPELRAELRRVRRSAPLTRGTCRSPLAAAARWSMPEESLGGLHVEPEHFPMAAPLFLCSRRRRRLAHGRGPRSPTPPRPGTIRVVGEATVSAKPDLAELDVGVVSEATTAEAAAAENAKKMEGLLAALKKEVGAGGEVKTVGYMVTQRHAEPSKPREQAGHRRLRRDQHRARAHPRRAARRARSSTWRSSRAPTRSSASSSPSRTPIRCRPKRSSWPPARPARAPPPWPAPWGSSWATWSRSATATRAGRSPSTRSPRPPSTASATPIEAGNLEVQASVTVFFATSAL